MTKNEIASYRERLLSLRERLTGDVSHLTDEALRKSEGTAGNLSNTPIHMADLGTDNFEQENTLSLLANEQQQLGEIDGALDRIRAGTFGRCEECQAAIPKARLKELPFTRFCVACARKNEQQS